MLIYVIYFLEFFSEILKILSTISLPGPWAFLDSIINSLLLPTSHPELLFLHLQPLEQRK